MEIESPISSASTCVQTIHDFFLLQVEKLGMRTNQESERNDVYTQLIYPVPKARWMYEKCLAISKSALFFFFKMITCDKMSHSED